MRHLLTLLCVSIGLFAQAQEPALWNKKFPEKIKWYKQTEAGVMVVCSGDALYGLKPEDGSELWRLPEFDGIREENYDPIEGSPFVAIVDGGMNKKHKILDVTTGRVIARSKELGFYNVTKRIECRKLGAILFYGMNDRGKPRLMLVDIASGEKRWEQDKLFEKNSEQIVSEAGVVADGILLATNRNVYKLSAATGDVIWSSDMKSDLPVVAAANPFSGKGATKAATATSADFFQYGDSSKIYFWNQDYITCYNLADGKETWKRVELSSPINMILHDKRGMLVATAEKNQKDIEKAGKKGGGLFGKIAASGASKKNRAGLYCFDYTTGAEKWTDEVDLQGDIIAYKMRSGKLILATQRDQGTNYITIADLDAGKSVTKKALKVDGEVTDIQIVPQGIYYRTANEINILDVETGDRTWKKGFKVKNCAGTNVDEKLGYVYGNGHVYKVDFEKGELIDWISSVPFKGDEEPTNLEMFPEGLVLSSSQNVMQFGLDGKMIFHAYEPAPGRSTGGKILSAFGGMVAAAGAMSSAAYSAQLSYAKGYYGSTSPALDREIKYANNMTSAWGNAAAASFSSINRRFKASKNAGDFMAVLTNLDNSNKKSSVGIVLIDKRKNQPGKKVLMADKDPDYSLDEIDRMIFFKNEKDAMTAYRF